MSQNTPLMIAVAPNGARKTQQDHPKLPISPKELAATAAECLAAGACMLHLHVRDAGLAHSLDATRYTDAISAIRREVGDQLIVQITTEAVGVYKPEQQMQTVVDVRPEAASLAIREFCPVGCDESVAAEFFLFLKRERIAPQYILYDEADVLRFNDLVERGIVPDEFASVLLVLGRYAENQQSDPKDALPLIAALTERAHFSLCAFGATEAECMVQAIRLGGHCRVGFENNLWLPDGVQAPNNAALVSVVRGKAEAHGRKIASADAARKLLGMT